MTGLGILSSKIHLETSGFGLSSQRSLQYWRPRPARDGPPGVVVRSGRYPATAFFGRLMSSLHSGMAACGGRHRPLVSTGPSLHLTWLSRGTKAKEGSPGRLSMSVPPGTMVPRDCPKRAAPEHLRLELTSPDPLRPDADDRTAPLRGWSHITRDVVTSHVPLLHIAHCVTI